MDLPRGRVVLVKVETLQPPHEYSEAQKRLAFRVAVMLRELGARGKFVLLEPPDGGVDDCAA